MDFDLTTSEGLKRALESFERHQWVMMPHVWLIKKAVEWVSSPDTIEQQRKTAIELLKAGKENDVDEMKITLDQNVGLDIGSDIEGIPLKVKLGKNGKMTLEATYKNR